MKPLTTKQRQIMKEIVQGNLDKTGARVSGLDYSQLLSRLPYKTSRDSLMCSIGILEKQGWLVKAGKELRDGRMKQIVEPTATAIRVICPPVPTSVPELVEIDIDSEIVELALL